MTTLELLLITVSAIFLLLVLVMGLKVHAFISLLLTSIYVGVLSGMSLMDVIKSIQDGMGGVLGFIALVVGIGSIFGEILQATGGTESLSRTMIRTFGEKRSSWAMMTTGFIIAIPVFFDVGFIILVPVVFALARKVKKSVLFFAIPLLAGLAVTHSFIPPTPGPIAVAEIIDVPLGWVILFGFIVGLPTVIIAGPYFGSYIAKKIIIEPPQLNQEDLVDLNEQNKKAPSFVWVIFLIGLPLVLILISTMVDMGLKIGWWYSSIELDILRFIGHPFIALLLATLAASYILGIRNGYSKKAILDMTNHALAPAGLIILVTGAGGVFKQILVDSGAGAALAGIVSDWHIAPVILAYILAAIIRVTQGSSTVAMITAAGMISPVIALFDLTDPHKGLIVLAIAAGATIFSHVNDSGFWLIGKYLNMTEKQTLQSWSVMETIVSVVGFIMVLLLSWFV